MSVALATAIGDIAAERRRQIEQENWTPEYDDSLYRSQLAAAAACYAVGSIDVAVSATRCWPWSRRWWKPADRRRNLVKAGALIIAEIERLDRMES